MVHRSIEYSPEPTPVRSSGGVPPRIWGRGASLDRDGCGGGLLKQEDDGCRSWEGSGEGKVEVLWGYGNIIIIYIILPYYLAKD